MHCSHAWATGRVVTEHYGLLYTRDFSGSLGAPPFSGVRRAAMRAYLGELRDPRKQVLLWPMQGRCLAI